MGHEGKPWDVSFPASIVGARAECLGAHPSSSWGAESCLKGAALVTRFLSHLLLTSFWLFPTCAVIITAFDLTDVQTLEHTRQVWESAAPVVPLGSENHLEGLPKSGPMS